MKVTTSTVYAHASKANVDMTNPLLCAGIISAREFLISIRSDISGWKVWHTIGLTIAIEALDVLSTFICKGVSS